MPAEALLNGEPASRLIPLDRACQFGDGLFETMAVRAGRPCLWGYHLRRLQHGCERLGLPPVEPGLLWRESLQLAQGREQAILKIIISAGSSDRGYARDPAAAPGRWLGIGDWPRSGPLAADRPLVVQECRIRLGSQPLLGGIKHLNRLEQVLARRELGEDADEGIVCDSQGRPLEGIAANLLLRLDDRYLTPPIDEAGVAGTVRQLLLDAADRLDLPLKVQALSMDQLYRGRALFMTSALLGIRPVARIGGHVFPLSCRTPELDRLHAACFAPSRDGPAGELPCEN